MAGTPRAPAKQAGAKGKKRLDWEAVERDYRTGQFTLRELETKHGVGYATISRRATKDGWTKDLREAVQQATNAKLIAEVATAAATGAQRSATNVVLAAAEVNSQVILRHRRDIYDAGRLAMDMMHELRLTTHMQDEIAAMAQRLGGEGNGDDDQMRQALTDLMSVHKRTGSLQKLADTMVKLQALERRAFGIKDDEDPTNPNDKGRTSIPIRFVEATVVREVGDDD